MQCKRQQAVLPPQHAQHSSLLPRSDAQILNASHERPCQGRACELCQKYPVLQHCCVLMQALVGDAHNRRVLRGVIARLVSLRRYEQMSLHQAVQGLKTSTMSALWRQGRQAVSRCTGQSVLSTTGKLLMPLSRLAALSLAFKGECVSHHGRMLQVLLGTSPIACAMEKYGLRRGMP